jgi:hypothetical protein
MQDLVERCLAWSAAQRPTAQEIHKQVQGMLHARTHPS